VFRRRPDPAPVEAEDDLIRIRMLKYLSTCLDQGQTHAPIRDMLDLLDPAWTPPAAQDKPDPRADPVTGCLPVTADGQMPR
jgi:hypothetical protein